MPFDRSGAGLVELVEHALHRKTVRTLEARESARPFLCLLNSFL